MGKLSKNEKKNSLYSFIFSVGINVIILALMLILCNVYYEMDDDVVFSKSVVDGFYNTAFTNFFLLKFLGIIQELIYPYCSFVIVSIVFVFFASCTLTRIMVDKFNYFYGGLITIFINGFFAVNYYLTISFTRLPGVLATVGFLTIVHYTRKKSWMLGTFWGMLLVVIASLYRYNVILLIIGYSVGFVGLLSLSNNIDAGYKKNKLITFLKIAFEPKRMVAFALVCLTIFSLNSLSRNINSGSEELQYYNRYTRARSAVYDFSIPSYNEAKEEYDAIGISENDLALFKHSYVDDNSTFTLENLKKMKEIKNQYDSDNKTIVSVGKKMLSTEFYRVIGLEHDGINIIAFLMIFMMFFLTQKKNKYFIPIILSLAVVAGYFYIYYLGRTVYRVLFPIVFSTICYLIYMMNENSISVDDKKRKAKNILASVLCVFVATSGFYLSYKKNYHSTLYPKNEQAKMVVAYAENYPNNKYVIQQWYDFSAMLLDDVKNVFYAEKSSYDNNYLVTSGVYYGSPMYTKCLEGFGTDNVYEELLKDNVYFVSNNEDSIDETMRCYLEEHYANGKTVAISKVDEVGNYSIYDYEVE